MKIFKFLLVSILFITVTACGDDDDAVVEDNTSDLVGTWQMTAVDLSGTSTTEFQGTTINSELSGFGKDIDYSITFSENPNEYNGQGSWTLELTTTIAGQSTTSEQTADGMGNGTWDLDGMTLTFTMSGTSEETTVNVLNENTLTFTSEQTESITVNGATQSSTVVITSTFTR